MKSRKAKKRPQHRRARRGPVSDRSEISNTKKLKKGQRSPRPGPSRRPTSIALQPVITEFSDGNSSKHSDCFLCAGTPTAMGALKERLMANNNSKRLLDPKRSEANLRERSRVKALTDNFDELFQAIPRDIAEPRLARIEIVRRAFGYIRFLTDLLETERPENAAETEHSSAWDSVPREEDDLSSLVLRKAFLDMRGGITLLPMKRVECNARARSRSRDTKAAFQALKGKLPLDGTEPELSRVQILRRATDYIACLTLILQEAGVEDDSEVRPNPTGTPSTPSSPSTSSDDHHHTRKEEGAREDYDHGYSSSSGCYSNGTAAPSPTTPRDSQSALSCSDHSRTYYLTASISPASSESGYDTTANSPSSFHSEESFSFDGLGSTVTPSCRTRTSKYITPTSLRAGRDFLTCSRTLAHPYNGPPSCAAQRRRLPSSLAPFERVSSHDGQCCLPLASATFESTSSYEMTGIGFDWPDSHTCGDMDGLPFHVDLDINSMLCL